MNETSITHEEIEAFWTPAIEANLDWIPEELRAARAREEVIEAIEKAKRGSGQDKDRAQWRIRVVPSLPKYRYVHSCPRCRSRAILHAFLSGGLVLRLCAGCRRLYDLEEQLR